MREADRGDIELQFMLGMGFSGRAQYDAAAHYLRLAAKQGHEDARFNLGVLYANGNGDGTDKAIGDGEDFAKAIGLLRPLAEAGHAGAQHSLALRYTLGEGVPKDHEEACRLFKLGAAQGHTKAQYELVRQSLGLSVALRALSTPSRSILGHAIAAVGALKRASLPVSRSRKKGALKYVLK